MFGNCLEQLSNIYDSVDSIMITNREGIIEYTAVIDAGKCSIGNEGYTGRHLLEVYPDLTEAESTMFRVMKTGQPIVDEIQTVTDWNGMTMTISCSTYPIELGNKIIGAVEGVILLDPEGSPRSKDIQKRQNAKMQEDRLYCLDDLITEDPYMKKVKQQIRRAAEGGSPVMLIGDTGTGKELAAQSIHSHSRRADGPFVSQNCSAIPMGLLESTLFGTARGSYTGAEDRRGLFELADRGTLFLDELNSMEISLQGKLLKAVEEQKIRRIGEERERKIDVRIVSAVNRDTRDILSAGELRRDLYYRLGVVEIRLPQLQERKQDIPVLIRHYIEIYNRQRGMHIRGYSELAQKMLLNYSWPGNIRELRNVVEYGFNMAQGEELTMRELPDTLLYEKKQVSEAVKPELSASIPEPDGEHSLTEMVESFEKELIRQACRTAPSMTAAAEKLRISRQALSYKLSKYGLKK